MNESEVQSIIDMLATHGQAATDPTEAQLRELLAGDPQGPFHFVNLLRFRASANYPADHELAGQPISGAEAYDKYGVVAFAQVSQRGGRLVTLNDVRQQLIGKDGGWHRVATMEYPSINAFIDMLMDPDYQASLVHRNAGLEATQVIVSRPLIAEPTG